jgi:hypothetical protein
VAAFSAWVLAHSLFTFVANAVHEMAGGFKFVDAAEVVADAVKVFHVGVVDGEPSAVQLKGFEGAN